MTLPHPSVFHAALTSERLTEVSNMLLTELYATEDMLSSDVDDAYTRGCTTFGRQKNRIKREAGKEGKEWLTLSNSANDLVFNIGGVPCRFSNDDPDSPQKLAVLAANRYQASFFDEVESGLPCRFCFVIDRGVNGDEEARVVFLGFDTNNTLRCRWISDSIRTVHSIAPDIPAAVDLSKPTIAPKENTESGESKSTGT